MADLKRVDTDASQSEKLLPADLYSPVTPSGNQQPPVEFYLDTPKDITMPSKQPVIIATANGLESLAAKSTPLIPRDGPEIRRTPLRWIILFLFVLYSLSNAFQWIQYSIITNVAVKYYGVSSALVNWTSEIYMILYIPLIFPAMWFLDKKGLRVAVLLGSFGTAVGAWIKCASISPDRFAVGFAGQTIVAASQIFILGIPAQLAAVWFGAKEVSTACSFGVLGNQLGIALGFLLPPEIVRNSDDLSEIGQGFSIMFFGTAAFCTALFVAIVIVFKPAPLHPPSVAAAAAIDHEENYFRSIVNLMSNRNYVLLLITYGINVGVFYAVSILLNQVFLLYFPGEEQHAGRVGLTIVIAGVVGSLSAGVILDKTHRFKETTLTIYILSFVGMVAYTFIYRLHTMWLVYLIAGLLGFFMTGYLPVGFEFAAEITYPQSEGTSSGLLNASAQIFGIIFTNVASALADHHSDVAGNLSLCAFLLFGAAMTVFIQADLKRQKAQLGTNDESSTDLEKQIGNTNHSVQ